VHPPAHASAGETERSDADNTTPIPNNQTDRRMLKEGNDNPGRAPMRNLREARNKSTIGPAKKRVKKKRHVLTQFFPMRDRSQRKGQFLTEKDKILT
jgi:hypothetical protein